MSIKFIILLVVVLSLAIWPDFWLSIFQPIKVYFGDNIIIFTVIETQFDNVPEYPTWRVFVVTSIIVYLLHKLYLVMYDNRLSIRERIRFKIFAIVRSLPFIKSKIQKKVDESAKIISKQFDNLDIDKNEILPNEGISVDNLLEITKKHATLGNWDWKDGRVSGAVYVYENEHSKLMKEVYEQFYQSNSLHPDVFPGVRKMEAEIVSITLHLYNGENGGCGTTTSGGNESILLAMKAYRDQGYSKGIKYPEIILCESAHSAFYKAASYFNMKIVRTKFGKDFKANVTSFRKSIGPDTVVMIGSAPGFPHGVIDPIAKMSDLAVQYKLGLHVDACLGGFIIPFMKDAGFACPDVDFKLPGVTSISCDTHKYGYGPKGCSVLLYRNKTLRAHQYFVDVDWSGGIYASHGVAGSRSGATIAGTWATMMHIGREGYTKRTKDIVQIVIDIQKEIRQIKEIELLGEPDTTVIAITSNVVDIYTISDRMASRGWHVNNLQFPSGFHVCFTAVHIGKNITNVFIKDLKESIEEAKTTKINPSGIAGIYGASMKIQDRSIVSELSKNYVDSLFQL